MSQEWLDIQSFIEDQKVLTAINDLSISIKQELAGLSDAGRPARADAARKTLKQFLSRLDELSSANERDEMFGVDARSNDLIEAFANARRDRANYRSILMRAGARSGLELVDASDSRAKRELLDSLAELRRVVARHQQTDVSAIFEDF